MKVIIAGSRSIDLLNDIYKAVLLSKFNLTKVVSGTASGADQLGELFASNENTLVK